MDPQETLQLLTQHAAEVVTEDEARSVATELSQGKAKSGYIGFEPSGRVHLGWKVTADKIGDLVRAGVKMKILLADWHAQINDKLGGNLNDIRACGEYMKDCFAALGVPQDRVEYLYASDYVNDPDYWATVIQVAKHTTLARMRRAMDILGRSAEEAERDMSKFLYPAMQVADIYYLNLDVAFGGLDQRHAHMLCRDIAHKVGKKPPLAIHTPLVPSLQAQGRMDPLESKMSKSNPASGVLIHDSKEEVEKKLHAAVCPAGTREGNPVLDLVRLVVFNGWLLRHKGAPFMVDRPEKFGGPAQFASYAELEGAYVAGKLHPMDLKKGAAKYVNEILDEVRTYFARKPANYERMQAIVATR